MALSAKERMRNYRAREKGNGPRKVDPSAPRNETGEKLTNAQIQARYRERNKEFKVLN